MKNLVLILSLFFAQTIIAQENKPKAEKEKVELSEAEEQALIEKIGRAVEKKRGYIKNRNSVKGKGLKVSIKGVYVNYRKLFFLFDVENKSNIDYVIEGAFFNTTPLKKGKDKILLEEKVFNPIWTNEIDVIKKKSKVKMVYGFDVFTLNDNKILNFNLREEDGEREVNLVIKPETILGAEYIRVK